MKISFSRHRRDDYDSDDSRCDGDGDAAVAADVCGSNDEVASLPHNSIFFF